MCIAYRFCSEELTNIQMCLRIQLLEKARVLAALAQVFFFTCSFFDSGTCVCGESASLASHAISDEQETASKNVAAATREADSPCSVNIA